MKMEKEHKKHKHEHNNQERHEEKKCNCEKTCACQDEKCECKHDKVEERQTEEIEKLRNQLTEILNEKQSLLEKLQYSKAEMINYRKRKEEETDNKLKYANQDLILEIIPVLDNFERAIKLDDNDLTDELSKFLTGFKMMYASLCEVLKKFGVEEIDCEGKEFDANTMQALMTDSDSNFEDDIVLDVLLKGYRLKDRVIRPASVKVNKIEK
jgi:molecular chaperone GrpE